MKHGGWNIACHDYEQWKSILREELASATVFEIHCWNEESEWIELALQYGSKKEFAWNCGTELTKI